MSARTMLRGVTHVDILVLASSLTTVGSQPRHVRPNLTLHPSDIPHPDMATFRSKLKGGPHSGES